jgi:hypothetical protein
LNREETSAKQAMMTPAAAPPRTTASTLARPTLSARTAGNPKTPLPMMQFTVSAAMLQRPMARTRPCFDELWFDDPWFEAPLWLLSVTASLYHKLRML